MPGQPSVAILKPISAVLAAGGHLTQKNVYHGKTRSECYFPHDRSGPGGGKMTRPRLPAVNSRL
jgi:hypothetical protein